VAAHRGCLKDQPGGGDAEGTSAPGTADTPEQVPPEQGERAIMPDGFLDACGRERRLVTRTRERYAEIRRRLDAGGSLSGISRATGLDRKTVQRFARAGSAGELLGKATSRESKLDKFTPYLRQRWNEGVTDAAALHAELRERGWAGSEQTVRRYVRPFWQALAAPDPAPAVPKTSCGSEGNPGPERIEQRTLMVIQGTSPCGRSQFQRSLQRAGLPLGFGRGKHSGTTLPRVDRKLGRPLQECGRSGDAATCLRASHPRSCSMSPTVRLPLAPPFCPVPAAWRHGTARPIQHW
jgi:hypothetical protein